MHFKFRSRVKLGIVLKMMLEYLFGNMQFVWLHCEKQINKIVGHELMRYTLIYYYVNI